ncbi:MAG: energy transducer TonB [Terracidiphilus sp.]|jgi:TonB family protein
MSLLKLNCFKVIRLRYAVSLSASFCICALAPFALAQSSTSETPGNNSHRSTRPITISSHNMGLPLRKTQPIYPPAAIAAGISGTVVLEATILGTGVVADVRILGGPTILEQESLKAVRTWRYRPYLLNDVPMIRTTKINVIFTLEEDGRATIKTTESEPEIVKTPPAADGAKQPESK